MKQVARFGVSLEKELLKNFDRVLGEKHYPNRSKCISDLITEDLVRKAWIKGKNVAGAITILYDHHKRDLMTRLTEVQHRYNDVVISAQHIHLDHHNCLEVVVVKGKSQKVIELASKLKGLKGVKHSSLTMSATGRELG